jgi:hypothetical protein
MIVFSLGRLGTQKCRVYALVAERYLVLLMVVDVSGIFDDTEEERNGISRELRAGKAGKSCVVKVLTSFWADLDCCAASSSLVIRETDTVHVGFSHSWELTYHLRDFGGSAVA